MTIDWAETLNNIAAAQDDSAEGYRRRIRNARANVLAAQQLANDLARECNERHNTNWSLPYPEADE